MTTALRILLGVKELEIIKQLREENANLKKELDLWCPFDADLRIPQRGKYYDVNYLYIEGHTKLSESADFAVALRFDGKRTTSRTKETGEVVEVIEYVFTFPVGEFGIWTAQQVAFETYQLLQISKFNWQEEGRPVALIDANNRCYVI